MWYKNLRAQNFLIILFSVVGLASTFYLVNLNPELNLEARLQIEKSVFSHLVNYITDHPDETPDYFFVSVSDSDPSPRVLNYFQGNIPIVEPISSSEMSFGFSAPIVHKLDPSKHGISINLEVFDKQPDGDVQVRASLYRARGSSATYEYTLNENEGIYRIISIKDSNAF